MAGPRLFVSPELLRSPLLVCIMPFSQLLFQGFTHTDSSARKEQVPMRWLGGAETTPSCPVTGSANWDCTDAFVVMPLGWETSGAKETSTHEYKGHAICKPGEATQQRELGAPTRQNQIA